jgi:hypothetical protein
MRTEDWIPDLPGSAPPLFHPHPNTALSQGLLPPFPNNPAPSTYVHPPPSVPPCPPAPSQQQHFGPTQPFAQEFSHHLLDDEGAHEGILICVKEEVTSGGAGTEKGLLPQASERRGSGAILGIGWGWGRLKIGGSGAGDPSGCPSPGNT